MKNLSIRTKIAILMTTISVILIVSILTVSYVVNKNNITTADVRTCMIDGKEVYVAFMCTVNDWVIFVQAMLLT